MKKLLPSSPIPPNAPLRAEPRRGWSWCADDEDAAQAVATRSNATAAIQSWQEELLLLRPPRSERRRQGDAVGILVRMLIEVKALDAVQLLVAPKEEEESSVLRDVAFIDRLLLGHCRSSIKTVN